MYSRPEIKWQPHRAIVLAGTEGVAAAVLNLRDRNASRIESIIERLFPTAQVHSAALGDTVPGIVRDASNALSHGAVLLCVEATAVVQRTTCMDVFIKTAQVQGEGFQKKGRPRVIPVLLIDSKHSHGKYADGKINGGDPAFHLLQAARRYHNLIVSYATGEDYFKRLEWCLEMIKRGVDPNNVTCVDGGEKTPHRAA